MGAGTLTLTCGADWAAAERSGSYAGSPDDRRDGFIHFSTAAQAQDEQAARMKTALASPDRPDKDKARDAARAREATLRKRYDGALNP